MIDFLLQNVNVEDESFADHQGVTWCLQSFPIGLLQDIQELVHEHGRPPPITSAPSSSSSSVTMLPLQPPLGLPLLDDDEDDIELTLGQQDLPDYEVALVSAWQRSWVITPAALVSAWQRSWLPPSCMPRPNGVFPWNVTLDKPQAHRSRTIGPCLPHWVQGQAWLVLQKFASIGAPMGHLGCRPSEQTVVNEVVEWMAQRPLIHTRLRSGILSADVDLMNRFGSGIVFGWQVEVVMPPVDSAREELVIGYHGTSLHVLPRALHRGMHPGWNQLSESGVSMQAIYCHAAERIYLCQNYALHSSLSDSGWYVAPILRLRFRRPDRYNRKTISRRGKKGQGTQWLCYPDCCIIDVVWFHAVHISEMWILPKENGFFLEGWYDSQYEPDPHLAWDDLLALSRECRKATS